MAGAGGPGTPARMASERPTGSQDLPSCPMVTSPPIPWCQQSPGHLAGTKGPCVIPTRTCQKQPMGSEDSQLWCSVLGDHGGSAGAPIPSRNPLDLGCHQGHGATCTSFSLALTWGQNHPTAKNHAGESQPGEKAWGRADSPNLIRNGANSAENSLH